MANADYIKQLQDLTTQNLNILKAINESFYSKQDYIYVNVEGSRYVIPSFVSLENKINSLRDGFNNLVNAPTTGEAYYNVDGSSRAIELKSYTHTPMSLTLKPVKNYNVSNNDIFKDFLTPVPYIKLDLSTIPNDITSVNIKKIIPKNPVLVEAFKQLLGENPSVSHKYSDIYKMLYIYKEDEDYVEYDSVKKLPIRKNIGSASYVIEKIISNETDDNLINYITFQIRSGEAGYMDSLSYRLFDETIEKPLQVGDYLINADGTGKMQIEEIYRNTNTIKVRVVNGEQLNLVPVTAYDYASTGISDLSVVRFFSPIDFDNDKVLSVPLEEDQYVYIAVAPLNDRMNVQSSWGTGIMIDAYKLTSDTGTYYKEYYDANVKNIGDMLYDMTAMMSSSSITNLTSEESEYLLSYKPILNKSDIKVLQINDHLNDSVTVKNIINLNSQKKNYNTKLETIQNSIDKINDQLTSISFDDVDGQRTALTNNLNQYISEKNSIMSSITKIADEISRTAMDSEVPLENAKYRIRGFYNYSAIADSIGDINIKDHVIGIEVQYRYKNPGKDQGNAMTITDSFVFSDWNIMEGVGNHKMMQISNGKISFRYPEDNSNQNEPSFNQIDIPITQGETVDVKLRLVYDFGQPFTTMVSAWSDIMNIQFPSEYNNNINVLDIISENNSDIETNRFNNIISSAGIPDHINDKIIDQDITYFHKPDNISSGYRTENNRIIPLKDKLDEMNNAITNLQDEIMGATEALSISVVHAGSSTQLFPWQTNNINVLPQNIFTNNTEYGNEMISYGYYQYDKGIVSTVLNLVIGNKSSHNIKLYSLFPGNSSKTINELGTGSHTRFPITDYCAGSGDGNKDKGVWLRYQKKYDSDSDKFNLKLQTANQFITFRVNDINTGEMYYQDKNSDNIFNEPNVLNWVNDAVYFASSSDNINSGLGAAMYVYMNNKESLLLPSNTTNSYMNIAPGEEIVIPIIFEYKLNTNYMYKTMSFDLRTSLYTDPVNYILQVTANREENANDILIASSKKNLTFPNTSSNPIKYNTIVSR